MSRILRLLRHPADEWAAIATEPMSVKDLLLRYVVPLSLIPSISTFIGIAWFGAGWDPQHGYSLSPESALLAGSRNFAFLIVTIPVMALVFQRLARIGDEVRPTYVDALKVATFGAVPFLLAGIFLVLPVLVMLMIVAGIHSLFLFNEGLHFVMKVRKGEAPMLVAISMVALTLATMGIGALGAALGIL